MKLKTITISAPGSIMLLGEHAVLAGHPAIVCAVNHRLRVTLTLLEQDEINIYSALGDYKTTLAELSIAPPLPFVLAALLPFKSLLKNGLECRIETEFSHSVGLGSSAAVTVAVIAGMQELLNHDRNPATILDYALQAIRAVQGVGSGADAAASIYGGVVQYQLNHLPKVITRHSLPLALFYCGHKTPTVEVIRYIEKKWANHLEKQQAIYHYIGRCSLEAVTAINEHDMPTLGKIFSKQQYAMQDLGLMDESLDQLLEQINHQVNHWGAKISGSGLGDCMVALIQEPPLTMTAERIPIAVSEAGLIYES